MERGRFARPYRALVAVALCVRALVEQPVLAGEAIRPTLDVRDMRVLVSYVSTGDLVVLQWKYGAHIDRRDLRQDHRHGFSILKTNRETGARSCEIYLPLTQSPREIDDEGTRILGHELLHCMFGDYHR
jgi:hypothetical protein